MMKSAAVFGLFALLLFAFHPGCVNAQDDARSRFGMSGLDLSPSNPLALPGGRSDPRAGSDVVSLSDGMLRGLLPSIPNLQAGFAYTFGRDVRQGRGILDYMRPFGFGDSTIFAEAHGEFQDFWKQPYTGVVIPPRVAVEGLRHVALPSNRRIDISFGGGYRRIFGGTTFLGANGFFDTTRLNDERWYSSGGVGLEAASLLPGDGLIDLRFNYYGDLFSATALRNVFRYGAGSIDFEAGYSQPLLDEALDLRVNATGYRFDTYSGKMFGYGAGAELTSRDGRFTARYDYATDPMNGPYHTISGYVNVGLRLENLLRGESPFTMPEPVFASPRNLRRLLSQPVRRNWHRPARAVAAKSVSAVPAIRALILTAVYRGPIQGGAFTVDVPNNSWVVHTGGIYVSNDFAYRFRMSDNSIRNVRMTVTLTSGSYNVSFGYSGGGFVRGPAPMNGVIADTATMFGPLIPGEYHWGDGNGNGAGFVTFDVPGDPSILPLVVNFRFVNP